MDKVLICHPGRQHAHQAALALAERDMLAGFILGLPSKERHARWVPKPWRDAILKHGTLGLPEELLRFWPVEPIMRHLAEPLLPAKAAAMATHAGLSAFDAMCARALPRYDAKAVIAYENSALFTFQAAKRLGWTTILDAASFHHATQDLGSPYPEARWHHRRICRRKDAEVARADCVITCSELARRSYLEAGVPPSRLISIPLGANASYFQPAVQPKEPGAVTFLFVGTLAIHKGVDILLDAFRQVHKTCTNAVLRLVGGKGNAWTMVQSALDASVSWQSTLSHGALAEEYHKATCLVLPSRLDSFGMVVAEALASGLPVIVSDHTGAKDLVEQGRNGWVIPSGQVEPLAQLMRWCAEHPEELLAMRPAAREAGLRASWERYREKLVTVVMKTLANHATASGESSAEGRP